MKPCFLFSCGHYAQIVELNKIVYTGSEKGLDRGTGSMEAAHRLHTVCAVLDIHNLMHGRIPHDLSVPLKATAAAVERDAHEGIVNDYGTIICHTVRAVEFVTCIFFVAS